jgi:hypothetical protein
MRCRCDIRHFPKRCGKQMVELKGKIEKTFVTERGRMRLNMNIYVLNRGASFRRSQVRPLLIRFSSQPHGYKDQPLLPTEPLCRAVLLLPSFMLHSANCQGCAQEVIRLAWFSVFVWSWHACAALRGVSLSHRSGQKHCMFAPPFVWRHVELATPGLSVK